MIIIPSKVFGRVVKVKIRDVTEWRMGERQCGPPKGRECGDQVFAVKQVMVEHCEKIKCVCLAFIDLEKAYYRVDIKTMCMAIVENICREWCGGRGSKKFI